MDMAMPLIKARLKNRIIPVSAREAFLALPLAVVCAALAAAPAEAQAPAEIKVAVTPSCEKGDSQFEIVNTGEPWPGMAMISLVRMDTKEIVTQREMRMRPGQRIVYRAKDSPDGVEVGLRIEPTWYKRPPTYDSIITCLTPPAPEAVQPPAPAATPTPAPAPPSPPR
jgi:hypothetical protein